MTFNKIFCIGFNKTGTSSMHRLFTEFGLKSWHGFYSHLPVTDPVFRDYQCFSDGDLHDFALLDRAFPGSRFIVTTRRFDDWLISRIRHVEYRRSIGATGPMREEYEANPELAVRSWIERRLRYHRGVKEYFSGRENDLLIIDICDGADPAKKLQKIAGFVAISAPPGMMLPHENPGVRQNPVGSAAVRSKQAVRGEVAAAFRALRLEEHVQQSAFP